VNNAAAYLPGIQSDNDGADDVAADFADGMGGFDVDAAVFEAAQGGEEFFTQLCGYALILHDIRPLRFGWPVPLF